MLNNLTHKIIPTVAVLVYRGDEVLLVKYDDGADNPADSYCLPSGHLKPGEKEIDAAVRKLENETGLLTKPNELFKIPEYYQATFQRKDGLKTFSCQVFLCRHYQGELKRGDHEIPEWIKISELKKLTLLPNIEKAVIDGLKYR